MNKILKKIKFLFIKLLYRNDTKNYVIHQYKLITGKNLNLEDPKTLDEKINWLKVYYYNPLYEKCSDKIEVRRYIEEKGFKEILTKLYFIYNDIDEIKLEDLPKKFVIKTTHSSGGVIVVNSKDSFDLKKAKKILQKSLNNNLWNLNREWQYKNLKPRIIVEELIEPENDDLIDYKFYCYKGQVKFIRVVRGLSKNHDECFQDFYDDKWNWINVKRPGHQNFGPVKKPKMFEEMKYIAKELSLDFEHVRVDLYCEFNKIYFGELTFTSGAGFNDYDPASFDYELGKYFNLDNLKKNNNNFDNV